LPALNAFQRQLAVDLDDRAARNRGVFREYRATKVVVDCRPVPGQSLRSRQQRAGAIGGSARLAQRGAAFRTGTAMTAAGNEDQHDMVAHLQVRDALAQLRDDASRLVPQRHRHRPRTVAVYHGQIGVA
jgi:hypothetical protein